MCVTSYIYDHLYRCTAVELDWKCSEHVC